MTPESPQAPTPDSRIDLNDDELKAIGRIVLSDARLGEVLEGLLWALIDADDNVGATLTKGWNFARILEALRALVRTRIEDDLQFEMLDWIRKAESAHKQRNSIVHSALVRLNPEEEQLMHFRIIPGEDETELKIVSIKPATLDSLANALDEIGREGLEFVAEFRPPELTS
jgi:hypothetical protein